MRAACVLLEERVLHPEELRRGGGQTNVCACVPKTCAQLGLNCGPAPDNCGNQIDCGTCRVN
jgi:hypothetical protein